MEGRRLVEAAADPDPEVGFAAVVALRGLVEVLEALQVEQRPCARLVVAGYRPAAGCH